MKKAKLPEPTIKRSAAADLLGVEPRTLRRAEIAGHLTPIKRNCRSTFYLLSEVEKLKHGEISTPAPATPLIPNIRAASGQFEQEVRA
ncbi:MAG: hypothetical protein WDM76_11820 [Limisphaerales bacterium]